MHAGRLGRLSGAVKNAATAWVLAPIPSGPPADFPSAICRASTSTISRMLPARMSASFFRLMLMNLIMATTATDTKASGMTGRARNESVTKGLAIGCVLRVRSRFTAILLS